MGRSRDPDVQEVPGFLVLRVGAFADLHQNDVVELQALDLPDVGDVHAKHEREILAREAAQIGNIASLKPIVEEEFPCKPDVDVPDIRQGKAQYFDYVIISK